MAIILDGCSGAGGAARGYVQAGHSVWGIDTNAELESDYLKSGASAFHAGDILHALSRPKFVAQFDFLHISPPCQRHSQMTHCRPGVAETYPDLIGPVRELLIASGLPWIIENVPGSPLVNPVTLCMFAFGRPAYRHRLFETGGGFSLAGPPAPPDDIEAFVASIGDYAMKARGADRLDKCGWPHPVPAAKAGHCKPGCRQFVSIAGHERRGVVNAAMDIDWMSRREDVAESIPPRFTRWIGEQI